MASKQKKQAENEKRSSVPKAPRMPLALPEGKLPDAYPLFLKQNKQECTDFFNENFHPDNINLVEHEVNLRRYIILGGVFSIVFVRKPRHTAFEKFNLTLHEDGRVMKVILNQLHRTRESSTRRSELDSTRQNIEIQASGSDLKLHLEPNELPFYIITFTVPKHLCLWSDPFVCQFIEEEIEIPVVIEEVLEQEVDKKSKKKRNRKEKLKESATARSSKQFDEVPISRRHTVTHSPQSRHSANIYRESALDVIRRSRFETELINIGSAENFALNVEPLNRKRATLLRKICMPRIISSFKFPQEFMNEQPEEQPTKKANGPIHRRRLVESVTAEDTKQFKLNYEDQADPERLYPQFPELEVSTKVREYELASKMAQDSNFIHDNLFGLIRTLDGIKEKYEDSPKKLEEQIQMQERMRMAKRHVPNRRKSEVLVAESSDREFDGDKRYSDIEPKALPRKSKLISSRRMSESNCFESKKVIHWTTKHILQSNFDRESKILTVKTDRLGTFGLAYPRYTHFPFRNWFLGVNEENPDEIFFTLDTYHVRVTFIVSKDGIRGYATDVPKEYIAKPFKYINIEKPVADFVELRKLFQDNNLNVFGELDAYFYIDQGYFCQKHLAAELHIYDAMTLHCKLLKFNHCNWNRLATERDILLCLRTNKDSLEIGDITVRVNPEAATFVEVSELCSDNLDIITLHYESTWRNIGIYSDLHQLINSMNSSATDCRNRDAGQMFYLRKLLQEVRPLSFS